MTEAVAPLTPPSLPSPKKPNALETLTPSKRVEGKGKKASTLEEAFADSLTSLDEAQKANLALEKERIDNHSKELTRTQEKEIELLQEMIKKQAENGSWQTLQELASLLQAATSMAIGGFIMGSAAPVSSLAGAAVMGSGALSATNFALSKLGITDKQSGTLLAFASGLLSIAGTATFPAYVDQLPKALSSIANFCVGVLSSITAVNQNLIAKEGETIQAGMSTLKGETNRALKGIEKGADQLQKSSQFSLAYAQEIKRIIQTRTMVTSSIVREMQG